MKKNFTFNLDHKQEIFSDQNILDKIGLSFEKYYGNEKPNKLSLRFLFDYAKAFDYVETKSIGGFDLFKN
ncbi:MAG: hypothetical protein LBM67_04805 [Lentimicrobiaceae bacterium]|jgi:hypothetical protein|nr:hypothetical protein [Lentimicrobiaceae bacterium]